MAQDPNSGPPQAGAAFVGESSARSSPPAAKAPAKGWSARRIVVAVLAIAAIGFGARYAYDWFVEGRFIVSTDDAYVGADTAVIAPKVAGYIVEVAVAENQIVRAGDLLARIDPGDYRLAVDAAKDKIATQDATLQRIGRQIDAQKAAIEQARAQVGLADAQLDSAEADQKRADLEFDRSQKLAEESFGSRQRLEQATADRARTAAAVLGAKAGLASAQAALVGANSNLGVMQAQLKEAASIRAELVNAEQQAERDRSFTEVRAPFDGVVGNKAVEVGQYVQPGVRLLAIVPLDHVYVDANFKETQLADIRPGQKAEIAVDALDGRVVS